MSKFDVISLGDSDGEEEIKSKIKKEIKQEEEELTASYETPSDELVHVKNEIKEEEEEYEEAMYDGSAEVKYEVKEEPLKELQYEETILPDGSIVPNFIKVDGVRERWNPEWDPLPPRVSDDDETTIDFNDGDEFNEWLWKKKRGELAEQGTIVNWCIHGPYCKWCSIFKPIQERAAEAAKYGIKCFDFEIPEEPGSSTEKATSDYQETPMEVDTNETTHANGVPKLDDDLKQRALNALKGVCENVTSPEDLKKEICRIMMTEFPNVGVEKMKLIFLQLNCRVSAIREEKLFLEQVECQHNIEERWKKFQEKKHEEFRRLFKYLFND